VAEWVDANFVQGGSYLTADVVRRSGTIVAGRMASFVDATGNLLQDAGFLATDVARLSQANSFATTLTAACVNTFTPTINDQTFASFTPAGGGAAGVLIIGANNDNSCAALISYRAAAAGNYCVGIALGGNVNVATTALTGTTGTNGKLTVSAASDGKIYIENRRGTNLIFKVLLVA